MNSLSRFKKIRSKKEITIKEINNLIDDSKELSELSELCSRQYKISLHWYYVLKMAVIRNLDEKELISKLDTFKKELKENKMIY